MAIVYGTELTYAPQRYSTVGISTKEFWGPGHQQAAQEFLKMKAGEENVAHLYHHFVPLSKEEK